MECTPSEPDRPGDIEVGQMGPDLLYWSTKEAVRQAEAKIKSQSEALAGIMTRATTLLGWTVTASLALAAALVTEKEVVAVVLTAACTVSSAVCAIAVIWPRQWGTASWEIEWFLEPPYDTELQFLDAMARGAAERIREDQEGIEQCAHLLRLAYLFLVLAPIVGAVAIFSSNRA
ncbi:hypothetical protein [Muricoccus nepalensis]|uniref:hypothetical protein n=1 Tax=Muricoccus nepalensis TaxID=1854500 RepID=UPI0011290AFF|nr:hypothetical protein [Roseomonas nepalensis]